MKKKLLYMFALVATATVFTGCKDQPDKYEVADGTPTVNYIRQLSTEITTSTTTEDTHFTNGEFVTSASPQALLCLVGENLRSVYEMYFNDQKAVLNSSYITDNTLIVQVPRTVPKTVSNKIYMITEGGDTVTYDFQVVISAPTVNSMSCEYAAAGTTATLSGAYFINDTNVPLTITFPNGKTAEIKEIDETYSSVKFVVPECDESGPITVTSIYGTTETKFYYKDDRGLMFDFDGVTGLTNRGWHDRVITTDDNAITGNYLQLGNGETTMSADGGWNDSQFSFEYWPGDWTDPVTYPANGVRLFDLVDFSDYKNMAIKFEMCIPSEYAWKAGAMQIIMAPTSAVSMGNAGTDEYGNTVAGCNNSYFQGDDLPRALYRPWTETGSFDTGGEWITVSIPIATSFIYGMNGGSATGSLSQESFASLVIFVVAGGISGTECTPLFKIDNIRAVPY